MTLRKYKILAVFLVTVLAFGLRSYAANRLSVDYDEPVYLDNAIRFANHLRAGKFTQLAWDETTFEHPAFYKILYGAALLTQPPLEKLSEKDLGRMAPIATADARDWNMVGRYLSSVFGTLVVISLAFVNPLAGLFLGVNTLSVNYTSEFYLEALPLFTSLLSALAYSRWFIKARLGAELLPKVHLWIIASAVLLGITAASKYIYSVVGLAIALHFLTAAFQKQIPRRFLPILIGWGALAVGLFFVFNPYLWPHPISRLMKTLTFHMDYQASDFVRSYAYPFWQPFRWLFNYLTIYAVRPTNAFLVNIDPLIFGLAVLGLPRLYQRNRLFFIWLILGIVILFIWTTKWPQYTLIVMVPFCLCAAEGAFTLFRLVRNRFVATL